MKITKQMNGGDWSHVQLFTWERGSACHSGRQLIEKGKNLDFWVLTDE